MISMETMHGGSPFWFPAVPIFKSSVFLTGSFWVAGPFFPKWHAPAPLPRFQHFCPPCHEARARRQQRAEREAKRREELLQEAEERRRRDAARLLADSREREAERERQIKLRAEREKERKQREARGQAGGPPL